ncbi:M3 family oligoendopeptidase [Fervidobacterium thailandense]|uniref:Peptidase M3 n=1 Tax=Fervidobacterium thailandense TaxID=1008305 RepID=A0A1E3G2S7_9BACT|nr:M3 family oligoendopeptidase [Fervidobacterium thailandense]ODN30586.1 peptidase M3 [Fervidobacterium thailandense]
MRWDLSKIFPDDASALEHANAQLNRLKGFVSKLETEHEPAKLLELIKLIEDSVDEFGKTSQYTWMRYSVATDDQGAQKLLGTLENLWSQVSEQLSVVQVHLSNLSDETLREIARLDPNYEHYIERVILERKHTLSKDAERILALTSATRRGAIAKIHSRLESSYTFEVEIDGQIQKLTTEQMKALRRSPDGNLRKLGMKMLLERFANDSIAITEIYNLIVKDYALESRLRNFERPISMMNFHNEVSDEIVDRLIETTSKNAEILRKYYRWKSKYMNEQLTLADVYAPLKPVKRKFEFEHARDIILDAYYSFSKKAGELVQRFFEEERIDLYPYPGKVSGAYCIYSTTKLPPYVLTNYNGDMYDVMTLAHELGHGLHGELSRQQTYFNHDTPLTLAELASVFGEFLVFDKLRKTLDGEERKLFTASKIEEIFATTFRQNMFTKFELRVFDEVERQGYLSWDELREIYHEVLLELFGDAVEIPEWYKNEWAMVSHFFETPFYVYAYNFANCLVIALYKKYLNEGQEFVEKYLELLSYGGKYSPEKLLSRVGIDITRETFWQEAFDFIAELVNEVVD